MTTAKTPNPQSRFRLPDPPPREPDEMTAFDHVYKHGNNRYLAIHLGNQDTTLVVADRWIIAHPDADRSRARRPDLLIAFNVDPAAYHASNGYIVSEQGKPPDFVPRSRLREHRSHRHRCQAPGLRRPRHLRILALRRNRTAPRRSPRRRLSLSATDTDLSPSSNCPTAPCRATALRSTYSCTGRTASYSGSTQRRSGPSSPTRTSYPAPNRPLPRPSGRARSARERSPPPPGTITQSIESDSTAGGVGRPAALKGVEYLLQIGSANERREFHYPLRVSGTRRKRQRLLANHVARLRFQDEPILRC